MKDRVEVYVHTDGCSMGVSPEEGETLLRKGLVVRHPGAGKEADFKTTDGTSFDDVREGVRDESDGH